MNTSDVSEADVLHLVATVADEVARAYRVDDPCELWSEGWLGSFRAMQLWDKRRPFLPYARAHIRGAMEHSLRARANR